MRRVTLSQIEAFCGIMRLGSFRAAASRLNLKQPTVSLGCRPIRLSAEQLDGPTPSPGVGDTLSFVVGYSGTTILLHRDLYGTRTGAVERDFMSPREECCADSASLARQATPAGLEAATLA